MVFRLRIAALLLLACVGLAGCARDPFARCDGRRSLADWFDEYGPLGCSCNHGHPGNCRCPR